MDIDTWEVDKINIFSISTIIHYKNNNYCGYWNRYSHRQTCNRCSSIPKEGTKEHIFYILESLKNE